MMITKDWIECSTCKSKYPRFITAMVHLEQLGLAVEMMLRPIVICLGCLGDACPACAASECIQGHLECEEVYYARKAYKESRQKD